ncbi:hypothetical protein NDU88_006534 [Pleurodeles waltl]|uniref:Uncharacterized protein n=1 Tax=Pleurodeles waltl TaxID=8319 RepID=A0AAV7QIA5_PLEWA|nr:hypothetical protein NDU88_006534 [Pleurodeles waltl]
MDLSEGVHSAPPLEETAAIMTELKAGVRAIDMRFDSLTTELDGMHERLDDLSSRLGATEHQVSNIEDGATALTKLMERIK